MGVLCVFLFHPFEVLHSNGIISLSYQMGKYFEEINRTIYFVCGLLTLTGCDLFGGSDQSSDETTDSSVLKAEKQIPPTVYIR